MNNRKLTGGALTRRNALTVALAVGLGFTGVAFGQATTGTIFGSAPSAVGQTIQVTGSGFSRKVTVGQNGRYTASNLPVGNYSVTLIDNGNVVATRKNVSITVGSGTEVDFGAAAGAQQLGSVQVSANALPTIDVSAVSSNTIITAQQLSKLPLGRSAEAVALLAPGAVQGSGFFTGPTGNALVSIGGSSVTENAYYINGFNTTDPLSGFGGLTLPYGAIAQEEVIAGGYGAAYGRSDGGVLNMVGKRGTNEWHFGGQIQWTPKFLRSGPMSYYEVSPPDAGELYQYRDGNKSWVTTVDAYIGGPLIKDKLYIFAAAEKSRTQGSTVRSTSFNDKVQYRYDDPKWYAKLDWNINDNNILELTGASNKESYQGDIYDFNYDTLKEGAFNGHDTHTKNGADLWTAKFTSYITDNLTVTALYGKMKGTYYQNTPGYDPTYAHIFSPGDENPAITGGNNIISSNSIGRFTNPAHTSTNTNMRLDVTYTLGDHTITAGIDNQDVKDENDGTTTSGPGYAWEYNVGGPSTYIIGGPDANGPGWQSQPWVDAPGGYTGGATGYYVAKYVYQNGGSVRTAQRAQYIEDAWQVNDRLLLKLGLRNDQFTNYNTKGIPYLRLTSPQWAPRLGFSWDVNGDSSFKVYGNVGRYYLAMPASVALRSAGASLFTREYYTYTGIDANGVPQNLTPINTSSGPGAPISANLEYGVPRDPKTAAATNIKSEFQDEVILGFDKKLNDAWVYGAKATARKLQRAIDDVGDSFSIYNKMIAMGIDPNTFNQSDIQGSYLFNPGHTNIFRIAKIGGGYYDVPMTNKDFGFPTTLKRKYYSLELYLEHPFDGKWYGKIDYLYSHSFGNSEGQVRSDIGQSDVSATVDWDYAQVMSYANGDLSNDRRHQIKAYGTYQWTPEFSLSGNVLIQSGMPRSCLGYYGPNQTNPGLGYGPFYHWCGGKPFAPGKERNPWQYLFSVSAEYRPAWADHKLGFNVMVYNIFNQQRVSQTRPYLGDSTNPIAGYKRPYFSTTPRYVRFGVSYDF